jgi:hypothetical protein
LKQEFGFTLAQLVLPLGLSVTFLLVSFGEAKADQVIGHSGIDDLNREVKACGWALRAETWAGQDGLQAQGDHRRKFDCLFLGRSGTEAHSTGVVARACRALKIECQGSSGPRK